MKRLARRGQPFHVVRVCLAPLTNTGPAPADYSKSFTASGTFKDVVISI
jgi:hypothetical protein